MSTVGPCSTISPRYMTAQRFAMVATIAKRCAVMYRGEIVEQGPTVDILRNPQHEYTRQLLAAVPEIDGPAVHAAAVPPPREAAARPVLEVRNLAKTYTMRDGLPVRAVDDVSFSLAPGEILGVVGESGSGKSTVARL